MQIEEIESKRDNGPKFDYTRRGEEVRRLAQTAGAEHVAGGAAGRSRAAARPATINTTDETNFSEEALSSLSGASLLKGSKRTESVINGLEQSFQGNTQDQNHQHKGRHQNLPDLRRA